MKTKALAVLIVIVAAALLAGCGSSSDTSKKGFAGKWESTGGSKLSLQVGAPTNGDYPVTFVGGDIEKKMTATKVNDTTYRADNAAAEWTFSMSTDDLMLVTITITAAGQSPNPATTTFKRL